MAAVDLLQLGVAADELGFDALWLGEHLLVPVGFETPHPTTGTASRQHKPGPIVKPETILLDPLVQLAAIAGATKRIRLATGIYILPLRHPLLTARAASTLQAVSGDRFLLGIGTGWLEEEFTALGVTFSKRRALFDETVEIMRRAWAGGPFTYDGSNFHLDPVQVTAEPVAVPLVLGGNTETALARAARMGDAWFSSGTPSFDEAVRLRDRLLKLRDDDGRTQPFRTYVRIDAADPALVERYRREGLDDVTIWADQVWTPGGDVDANRGALGRTAEALGLLTASGESTDERMESRGALVPFQTRRAAKLLGLTDL